jgi:DNA-binding phage protein
MSFEKVLRELVKVGGLRKVARSIGCDHASLYKSIQDGSNVSLGRVEAILNLFGMELKAVKRKEAKPGKSQQSKKRR